MQSVSNIAFIFYLLGHAFWQQIEYKSTQTVVDTTNKIVIFMSKNSGKVKKEIPFKAQPCNKGG